VGEKGVTDPDSKNVQTNMKLPSMYVLTINNHTKNNVLDRTLFPFDFIVYDFSIVPA
jgi:hypothetical protein